jgi:hypothetical protein
VFDDKAKVEYVFIDGTEIKPSEEPPPAPAGSGRRPSVQDNSRLDDGEQK